MTIRILRGGETDARLGMSRSTRYARIQDGLFPPPIRLGHRAAGYPDYEIESIQVARIAGATDDEIRALVRRLVAARRHRGETV